MGINLSKLSKQEIVWLNGNRCRHRHTYLEHYSCYLEERGVQQRIGFLDIETSNLVSTFGLVLCWCIKELGKKDIIYDVLTDEDLENYGDKRIVQSCIDKMRELDVTIGYWSSRFDIPFLRSRALMNGLDFPGYGELFHEDLYYTVKNKLRLHRYRLDVVEEALTGKTRKTRIKGDIWLKALRGNKKALDWIVDHCKRDVLSLEDCYNKLQKFKKPVKKSV